MWFDDQAEAAAKFYCSILKRSKVKTITRYGESGAKVSGRPKGSVMTVTFELDGQEFMGLNGGPLFKFTEAVSFIVNCKTQKEADYFWEKLSAGGKQGPCGWLKDKYGLSWQIVPTIVAKLMLDKDAAKSERVKAAILRMKKLDIRKLKQAYQGR